MENPDPKENRHREEQRQTAKKTTGLHEINTDETTRKPKPAKQHCGDPPTQDGFWKRNIFNALLTAFTAIYAVSFLYGTYVTENPYLTFGRRDGTIVAVFKNDAGINVFYANTGRTPAFDVVFQAWITEERQVVPVGDWLISLSHKVVPAGYPIHESIAWSGGRDTMKKIRTYESSVGVFGRITYKDLVGLQRCIEFTAVYMGYPYNRFISGGTIGLCNKIVKSVRYNRVCVASADKKSGTFIATWEGFITERPGGEPSPVYDTTPCIAAEHAQENEQDNASLSRPK